MYRGYGGCGSRTVKENSKADAHLFLTIVQSICIITLYYAAADTVTEAVTTLLYGRRKIRHRHRTRYFNIFCN